MTFSFPDKYIDPLTDFGFKRLFGTVFNQLFEVAEIANFSKQEQALYQESLKVYRDNFNVTQTLIQESRQAGIEQGIERGVQRVAKQMKEAGLSTQEIARFTGLSEQEIAQL